MIASTAINVFCKMRDVDVSRIMMITQDVRIWDTRYMIWHYLHYYKKFSAGKLSKMFHRNVPSIFRGIRLIKHQILHDDNVRDEYYRIVEILEGETEASPSND